MNRARKEDESFDDYRESLKDEAKVMKFKSRGRWVWKTFFPIDSTDNLPKNSTVWERDEDDGHMIETTTFDPKNKRHYVKFPPYHVPAGGNRRTFSQQRTTARALEKQHEESKGASSNSSPIIETDGERV